MESSIIKKRKECENLVIWIKKEKEWKDIIYKDIILDRYQISNYGEIRNKKTGRIIKTFVNYKGYEQTYLRSNTGKRYVSIHRLVAIHFIKNDEPEIRNEVNHKYVEIINNKKFKSNYFENLEWVTRMENVQHSIKTGLTYHFTGEDTKTSRYKNEHIEFICKQLQNKKTPIEIIDLLYQNFQLIKDSCSEKALIVLISKIKTRRNWTSISYNYNF
jgi:hypothetical protein